MTNQCHCICDPNRNPVLRLLMMLRGMNPTDSLTDRPSANWEDESTDPNNTNGASNTMTTMSMLLLALMMYAIAQGPKNRNDNGTSGDAASSKNGHGPNSNGDGNDNNRRGGNHDRDLFGI